MYTSLFKKRLLRKTPFHQKVLHFQYDIPLCNLKAAFDICTQPVATLYMAEDSVGQSNTPTLEKRCYDEEVWFPDDERRILGVFDELETFYLRLEIDSRQNEADTKNLSGNLFYFADEECLYKVAETLHAQCGQVILESAADYFLFLED